MNDENNTYGILGNIRLLDLFTLAGFGVQLKNIHDDTERNRFIDDFIMRTSMEISILHKENDIIIDKLNELQKTLDGRAEDMNKE